MLREGTRVQVRGSGTTVRVGRLLGGGTQGLVYEAKFGDQPVALKWFRPEYLPIDPGLRERLENTLKIARPGEQFLWPMAIVDAPGTTGFGYLMPLREKRFASCQALIDGQDGNVPLAMSFRGRTTAGWELAVAFHKLHANGRCYGDINLGNIYVDPQTGEIRIGDNDNVVVTGVRLPVSGSWGFMAPEIVRGEASPTVRTDNFSLAVLLFRILVTDHPLDGVHERSFDILDDAARTELYGTRPVFVFDPGNRSNPPDPKAHPTVLQHWPVLPWSLREMFGRAFIDGLRDPSARPLVTDWRRGFAQARDLIVYCTCRSETFFDPRKAADRPEWRPRCWRCGAAVALPPRLVFKDDGTVVMLNHDSRLYPSHMDRARHDFTQPVAEVAQNPADPRSWGLRNLSDQSWAIVSPGEEMRDLPPGRSVVLREGTRIRFNDRQAEIRA